MSRPNLAVVALAALLLAVAQPAFSKKHPRQTHRAQPARVAIASTDGVAEARLLEIYGLIGKAQNREALLKTRGLVQDLPNFQLAQLVYGDLLTAQLRPLNALGDVPPAMAQSAGNTLNELREESQRRIKALRERPLPGTVPSQFLALSPRTKHAIAVDASRSRLYLFENSANGLKLVADYYISLGKEGTSKTSEGDQRTPLGVYYINSNLDRKKLKAFYGSGALPINYPIGRQRWARKLGWWRAVQPDAAASFAAFAVEHIGIIDG